MLGDHVRHEVAVGEPLADRALDDGIEFGLAVVPVGLNTTVAAGSTVRHWDLSVADNGRLLTIAGLPVHGLASVSVVDVESGAILWQSVVSSMFGAPGSVARMGVAMQGGRQYRIVASAAAGQVMSEQAVVAMVLPAR